MQVLSLGPANASLTEQWWDLILNHQKISKVSLISQLELVLFCKNALPEMFGNNAKTEEINLVSLLDKQSSLDLNGPTRVLESMLDLTILTMLLLLLWTKLLNLTMVTSQLTSTFHLWIITSSIVQIFQLTKIRWSTQQGSELLEILLHILLVQLSPENKD